MRLVRPSSVRAASDLSALRAAPTAHCEAGHCAYLHNARYPHDSLLVVILGEVSVNPVEKV